MNIEDRIILYLEIYGNTSEIDIISYIKQNSEISSDLAKKIINRMTIKNKIYRIVHDKLKPPIVYLTLEEPLPSEIKIENQTKHDTEVKRILQEAASFAQNRSKSKF